MRRAGTGWCVFAVGVFTLLAQPRPTLAEGLLSSHSEGSTPEPLFRVEGIPPAVAVAAGGAHVLVLARDGTLWAWGRNEHGQLGRGTIGWLQLMPLDRVVGLSRVVAIAAGYAHSLALDVDGMVWEWGADIAVRPAPHRRSRRDRIGPRP